MLRTLLLTFTIHLKNILSRFTLLNAHFNLDVFLTFVHVWCPIKGYRPTQ